MKKVKEKVKDIVEVRHYESVPDFLNDPARTVSNYHFSDVTSELMVKWLDSLAQVSSNGTCRALAGYRGVGKSHFLAMVSVIASHPEMRSRVDETYVAAGCQRLLRRHYPVVNIRRGLRDSFLDEIADAIGMAFNTSSGPNATITDLLESAKRSAGDLPLIVLIDTAPDRNARVERNDGPALAEIAEQARRLGIFVGLALDDDIAGADGANSAIANGYAIDFLDQEHLYKVVNGRIFPKNSRMQGLLGEIYAQFREAMPHFRWSEQRFASLYPLHPATLDVSPYIRLYVPDFAILGFAAMAGERILGRPADSLIGLEEIFDAAEAGMRKSRDLETAFASYDLIAEKCVGSLPISERHRAKLILKALFLLSLDGRGSTVGELAASLMIFDEGSGKSGSEDVRNVVEAFATSAPESLTTVLTSADSVCYLIRTRSDENLTLLDEAVRSLSEESFQIVLRDLLRSRFPELQKQYVDEADDLKFVDLNIEWRGGLRPGRIHFDLGNRSQEQLEQSSELDWELFVSFETYIESDDVGVTGAKIQWRPDQLREDEKRTLLSNHLLLTDTNIRTKFGEQLPAALHAHGSAAEAIVDRIMLVDARLSLDGFDYNFSESARSAPTLSEVLSIMLEPLFETRFPEHPHFAKTLTEGAVQRFVARILGDPLAHSPADEELARTFGVPLGISVLEGDGSVVSNISSISTLPLAKQVIESIPLDPAHCLDLNGISAMLSAPPLGLVKEARQILLACLVSGGVAEFVTRSGGRVNGRSLDLKIAWDDITGIALPRSTVYESEKITQWARLITQNQAIQSLDSPDDRALVLSSLVDLSASWEQTEVSAGNEKLPETDFNLEIWDLSSKPLERYALMIRSIEDALLGEIDLEECIFRICNIYGGDPDSFKEGQISVSVVASFSQSYQERQRISNYLQLADLTVDPAVEKARVALLTALELARSDPSEPTNRDLGYAWEKFGRLYREYYCSRHEMVMRTNDLKSRYAEIIGSEKWKYFNQILAIEKVRCIFQPRLREIRRQMLDYSCPLDPTSHLEHSPNCACLFRLSNEAQMEELPELLWREINSALAYVEGYLREHSLQLVEIIENLSSKFKEIGTGRETAEIARFLTGDGSIGKLSDDQISILGSIIEHRESLEVERAMAAQDPLRSAQQEVFGRSYSLPFGGDVPDPEQVLSLN